MVSFFIKFIKKAGAFDYVECIHVRVSASTESNRFSTLWMDAETRTPAFFIKKDTAKRTSASQTGGCTRFFYKKRHHPSAQRLDFVFFYKKSGEADVQADAETRTWMDADG
jgi:hypothetical protein